MLHKYAEWGGLYMGTRYKRPTYDNIGKRIIDPRPDLADDTIYWNRILGAAQKKNVKLAYILHGFRCGGLRICDYKLRPDYDDKESIWANKEEYEQDRDEWLVPYREEIRKLLSEINY
jgi:hypothetical protein